MTKPENKSNRTLCQRRKCNIEAWKERIEAWDGTCAGAKVLHEMMAEDLKDLESPER